MYLIRKQVLMSREECKVRLLQTTGIEYVLINFSIDWHSYTDDMTFDSHYYSKCL